jgi:hypothetical protein
MSTVHGVRHDSPEEKIASAPGGSLITVYASVVPRVRVAQPDSHREQMMPSSSEVMILVSMVFTEYFLIKMILITLTQRSAQLMLQTGIVLTKMVKLSHSIGNSW